MTNAYYLNQFISTTLSTVGGIDDSQTTGIKITSTSGVATDKPGILCLSYSDPIDTTKAEWISYTSIDVFNELQGVTRGEEGFSAKAHSNGVTVAFPISRSHINNLNDALIIDDTETNLLEGILDEDDMASNSATKGVTQQSIKAYVDLRNNAPEGFLINGKIVPSVASNNLTVAIKGLDGNDPSATNPVYIMLGGVLRSITSALSVTKNAGTNWCDSGSAKLATKEVDYFVYLGYNATDGVVIGFSRIPYANLYSHFSTTSTDSRYCAISTITNAVAGDKYTNIGRFGATLSAGAGYTWTVPTFTKDNLIQRPVYETRWLYAIPIVTLTGAGTVPVFTVNITKYKILNDYCYVFIELDGDGGADGAGAVEVKISSPISMAYPSNPVSLFIGGYYGSVSNGNIQFLYLGDASNFNLRITITSPLNADQFGAGARYITGSGLFSLR